MALTQVNAGLIDSTSQPTSFKNRIINGAMMIDQRNAGASVTVPATTTTFSVDRWLAYNSQASKFTMQQSSSAPAGFTNSLLITSSAATTVGVSDYYQLQTRIEGYNVADCNFGTANAKTVTLSFWVNSSVTGTFGGTLANSNTSRCYPFTYTINSANTWEQKTVTVAGDTTSTGWVYTNGIGLIVNFSLGMGSSNQQAAGTWYSGYAGSATGTTNFVGTNGATFYITGVQLEKGSTATSFDYRPYGTELALCQRYYETLVANANLAMIGTTTSISTQDNWAMWQYKTEKRATPSVSLFGSANWGGGTPTITPSTSLTMFYRAGVFYTASATGNVLQASSEL